MLTEHRLNLAQFYAITADLNLAIDAAQKVDIAVG